MYGPLISLDAYSFISADVSTTMILTPGPVIEFLKANQGVRDARSIDWVKVKFIKLHQKYLHYSLRSICCLFRY